MRDRRFRAAQPRAASAAAESSCSIFSLKRERQSSLASLTSFTYHGDKIVSIGYSEPARDLLPAHLTGKARRGDAQVAKSFGA